MGFGGWNILLNVSERFLRASNSLSPTKDNVAGKCGIYKALERSSAIMSSYSV